jgi:serine O-acetyltransferase
MSDSEHIDARTASQKAEGISCGGQRVDVDKVWSMLREDATRVIREEPTLHHLIDDVITSRDSLASSLGARLARRLAREDMPRSRMEPLFDGVLHGNPKLVSCAARDLLAIYDRDPACFSPLEPLLFFKGFLALATYRVAHQLWNDGRRWLALYLQSVMSEAYAVDIHPAARIGSGILLDHATSFVVGETAIIEDDVSILHEVTLGGTGKHGGDRAFGCAARCGGENSRSGGNRHRRESRSGQRGAYQRPSSHYCGRRSGGDRGRGEGGKSRRRNGSAPRMP